MVLAQAGKIYPLPGTKYSYFPPNAQQNFEATIATRPRPLGGRMFTFRGEFSWAARTGPRCRGGDQPRMMRGLSRVYVVAFKDDAEVTNEELTLRKAPVWTVAARSHAEGFRMRVGKLVAWFRVFSQPPRQFACDHYRGELVQGADWTTPGPSDLKGRENFMWSRLVRRRRSLCEWEGKRLLPKRS